MEALRASYGDASSDSDSDASLPTTTLIKPASSPKTEAATAALPPPPLSLLTPPNSLRFADFLGSAQPSRVRSFPHVEGNYALHVYIPVSIPATAKKGAAMLLKKLSSLVPGLHVVDGDIPLNVLGRDSGKLEQIALGREFHISLGRTVPIRVHQIDSVVAMLRQKLQFQKRYWIDFSKWAVFVNDDQTRTFLSMEVVAGGLAEIVKQIRCVNEVYRLHNLPEFYKDPRPHISVAWACGDISDSLRIAVEEETKRSIMGSSAQKLIFSCKFSRIECKIGNKLYKICKNLDE